MRLHELFEGLPVRLPEADPEVVGLCHDSRRIGPGELFVAIVGARHDGRLFAEEAARRGAVAVVGPPKPPIAIDLPWVETRDPRALLATIARKLYNRPDERLKLVGVTGTNGKTTVVTLAARLLEAGGSATGVLGTLGYRFGEEVFEGERTTPEASDFFRILDAMVKKGARAAAMEVSSHALELGRVAGARFDVAAFTNLSRDHLDFHPDMEAYFAAKRRLFDQLKPRGRAVVNLGDEWGRRLATELAAALPEPITCGPGGKVEVRTAQLDLDGIRATLTTPKGEIALRSPLLGRFNLENLTTAAAIGCALGLPPATIATALAKQKPLRGRLEPVAMDAVPVVIDYAHTPAALELALRSLRELTTRKLAVVFGCGGDRDPGKRPLMGRAAGELADLVVVTSDNPRSEDPLRIIAAVEEGVKASGNQSYRLMPDRREAIRRTLSACAEGWVVLVAGKGHEEVQIIGSRRLTFSDHVEVAKALEERRG